jgi:glutathione S-transferase
MKLHGSPTSPYVRKVRVLARELAVRLDGVLVKVHEIPSDYGRINPVNRIPALEIDDGTLIYDSRVICEYLDVSHGSRFLPQEGAARWQTLKLQVFGDGLMDAATPCVGELARPPERQWPHRLAEYERSMSQTLDALEAMTGSFGASDLGAISVGCALGYLDFRLPEIPWRSSRPRLARWYDAFADQPSMVATSPLSPWS